MNWQTPFCDLGCALVGIGRPFRAQTLRHASLQAGERVLDVGCGTGIRLYSDQDLSCLEFILPAQQIGFTLAEIAELLKIRDALHKARKRVRELTARKLNEVETRLAELRALHNELALLINLCSVGGRCCGIIRGIDMRR